MRGCARASGAQAERRGGQKNCLPRMPVRVTRPIAAAMLEDDEAPPKWGPSRVSPRGGGAYEGLTPVEPAQSMPYPTTGAPSRPKPWGCSASEHHCTSDRHPWRASKGLVSQGSRYLAGWQQKLATAYPISSSGPGAPATVGRAKTRSAVVGGFGVRRLVARRALRVVARGRWQPPRC